MWALFREAVSDQVICCAPVINSQIQSGMSGELTCSSFHTLANRSAQWAENQYRVRLKIVHPNTDCPLNNNTTTAAGQNAGFRRGEKEEKKKNQSSELALPSDPLLLTSTAPISPRCFLATQEPGNTRRKSLPSKRQRAKSERLKDVNKQAQSWTNTPALSSTCTYGKQTQRTCASVWLALYSSPWPTPDSCRLQHVFNCFNYDIFKGKVCDLSSSVILIWSETTENREEAMLQIKSMCPTFCITLQFHSVTLPSNSKWSTPNMSVLCTVQQTTSA